MVLFISLCWMLSVESMMVTFADQALPLGMAEDSVDDMYFGCENKMKQILDQRFSKELQSRNWDCNPILTNFNPKFNRLTNDHIKAICIYTSNSVYKEFNKQVRENSKDYGKSFQFHHLHFLLTSALQVIKSSEGCQTTYRRTTVKFIGNVNDRIRLGSFASSSKKSDQKTFGNRTCFKINTCYGAYVKDYSIYPDEEEVLIPPYEMFTVQQVKGKDEVKDLEDCEKVFVLESAGVQSKLNCRLAQ
ncbi:hypothetical protein CHARACLAT_018872 [Characodon lateralis]|uniref:NAD(P)(+)--arginine ADP-ribosyltransferase n=1 Tax=Characodon lateralis TaxID=208331 RepID=A0ABU7DK00_9TELE|nr:hypothetical protein [Characodon lateralis]